MSAGSGQLRVGVTYNLKSGGAACPPDKEAEYDDLSTVSAIKGALEAGGCSVELIEASDGLPVRLADCRPDIVFNIAEGVTGRGREAHIPAILNFLNIPFTGSDETAMCIAMDKALTKRLVSAYNIRTPNYTIIANGGLSSSGTLSWPVIIKPNLEGSGKGISDVSVVSDEAGLRRVSAEKIAAYNQEMIAEEYISGREFTVGILGNEREARVFPPMEIIFNYREKSIYSYEVKRNFKQYVRYECPPDICDSIREEIEDTAKRVFGILKCRDYARVDFRLSPEGLLYFIEINPIPGLAPGYSDFPMLAEFCGVSYNDLIQDMLNCALSRYGLQGLQSKGVMP